MAGLFDGTLKQLFDVCTPHLIGCLAPFVGLPAGVGATPLDADLSVIQPVADRVFQLQLPAKGLLHVELQSSWDGDLATRLLLCNVLLEERYGGPVHTVVVLLRREASSPALTGTITRRRTDGQEYLKFTYAIVRLWELPVDTLMGLGLGTMPLALLTDEAAPRLQEIVDEFAERVEREAPTTEEANLILSCGFLLLGLRYDEAVARTLFRGIQKMRESSTYQSILNEGLTKGRSEGLNEGLTKGRDEGSRARARARARSRLNEGLTKGRDEGVVIGKQEDLLEILQERFGTVPPEVETRIRATTDLTRLRAALKSAIHVTKPEDLTL